MKLLVKFLDFSAFKLGFINKKTILILKTVKGTHYLNIPHFFSININNDSLEISCSSVEFSSVFNVLESTIQNIKENKLSFFKRKLLLNGLGFRSTFDKTLNNLVFKLGYSHLSSLKVPSFIKDIKIIKKGDTTVLVESSDKILLGNYIERILYLRKSDSYKGKGFFDKYKRRKLKQIKKK